MRTFNISNSKFNNLISVFDNENLDYGKVADILGIRLEELERKLNSLEEFTYQNMNSIFLLLNGKYTLEWLFNTDDEENDVKKKS